MPLKVVVRSALVLFAAALCLAACGDDDAPIRARCGQSGPRLALEGTIGPTRLTTTQAETFGGRLADTVITPNMTDGVPHVLSFTSNTPLDVDLWSAILQRLTGGSNDAGRLIVSTRPSDIPCDPRDGQICAAYGVDTNNDGILFGPNEVIYPVATGEVVFTEVTGNVLVGDFDITFGPLASGSEDGGEAGGRLQGCFYYFRTRAGELF